MKKVGRRLLCALLLVGLLTAIAPTVALGATIPGQKWYVRVYNVDDIGKVYVNGNLLRTVGYKGDSGWVDVTTYVSGTGGNTKIRFTTYNKLYGYAWGFQIATAVPGQALQVLLTKKAGTAGVSGANSNDQTKPNRIVFDQTVYVKNLPSSYASKCNAFISDTRWDNKSSWDVNHDSFLIRGAGTGCNAYTVDFCKYVFGKTGAGQRVSAFSSVSGIRAGDVLHMYNSKWGQHWFVVLARTGNTLYTAEGNASGKVRVGNSYTITGSTLTSIDGLVYTFTFPPSWGAQLKGSHMQ